MNQLSGEIPSEIGNLINLTHLDLGTNDLTGKIPESICEIYPNINQFNITHNHLCPPYPECLTEEDIGEQDTLECYEPILGDINEDGQLNVLDIVIVANMVLVGEYDEIADVNEDGELNILDLVIMVNLVLNGND